MADADAKELAQSARKYWSAEGYTEGGVIREVDYATQSGGLDPMFAGIKIVDCDTHITEAPDLFTSRAPAAPAPTGAMPITPARPPAAGSRSDGAAVGSDAAGGTTSRRGKGRRGAT